MVRLGYNIVLKLSDSQCKKQPSEKNRFNELRGD